MLKKAKTLAAVLVAVFVIYWIGHRLLTQVGDEIFGPDYETKSTYSLGLKTLTIADQGSGATVGFCTSFHIDWRGLSPSSANRVLVLPNQYEDLNRKRNGNDFTIQVPGENKLRLASELHVDGITIHLEFAD